MKRSVVSFSEVELRRMAVEVFSRPVPEGQELVERVSSFGDELASLIKKRKLAAPRDLSLCEDMAQIIVVLGWLASARRTTGDPKVVEFLADAVENQIITNIEEVELH
jgi:hypothetical protein